MMKEGRGETTKERNYEYSYVKKRVESYLSRRKNISEEDKEKLLKEGTLALCVKWNKGFDVAYGVHKAVGENDLYKTMEYMSPANFPYMKQLVKMVNSVTIFKRKDNEDD